MIVYIYAQEHKNPLINVHTIRASIARDVVSAQKRNALQPPGVRVNNSTYTPRPFELVRAL